MSTPIQAPVAEFAHDEEAFRNKIPYKLISTNLKGVYAHQGPDDDFDLKSASQLDLVKHGILLRKPGPQDSPEVHAAWNQFTSHKWLEKDRIIPHMEPQIGKIHILKQKPRKTTDGSYLTNVWAGAGGRSSGWTTCSGNWTIPTVSRPPEAAGNEGFWNTSSWVGIDGFFVSNDVLQAGIDQHVNSNGTVTCVAWYEWYAPATSGSPGYIYQTNITNFPVAPGQQVSCSVSYLSNHTGGTLSFGNVTTGQHFTITLAPPPGANFNGSSYEWVVEAPDGGEPTSSLPRFSPVTFTAAIACNSSGTSANPATGDIINIENAQGKVLTSTTVGTDTCTVTFIG